MAAVQNERDKIIQATSPRLRLVDTPPNVLNADTRGIRLSTSDFAFYVDKVGVTTPDEVVISAAVTSFPPDHPITWSIQHGTATLTTLTARAVKILRADMGSDSVRVSASATYLGSTYDEVVTITKVYAGEDGVSPDLYAVKPSLTSLVRDALGNLSAPSVTFSAFRRVGAVGTLEPYAGRIRVQCLISGSWVTSHTPVSDTTTLAFTVPYGTRDIIATLFRAGGLTEELDRVNVPVLEDGVDIAVRVESTNGTVFRVGQSRSTTLIGRVFRNAVEITDEIPAHRFRWIRVSLDDQPPPNDDATWNAAHASGFKHVSLNVDSVYAKATFHCQIIE